MGEETAVLFANDAFYAAFVARDFAAMSEVWSSGAQLACVHPGWPPLHGREQVMDSWRGILGNPRSPAVQCRQPRVILHGDMALVICFEIIDDASLVASNLFVREGRQWRLVMHQASPTQVQPPPGEDEDAPPRMQ